MSPEVLAPVQPHTSALGVFLSLLFASLMGSLLWWMLHPPKAITAVAAKVKYTVGALKRILVPTVGEVYSEKGVELACRLGREQNADILLAYVIEVPFTLPLGAPLERAEAKAKEALERAEGVVTRHRLRYSKKVERARQAADGIIRVAKDEGIDIIVVSLPPSGKREGRLFGRTTEVLLRRAPCELVINKQPAQSAGGESTEVQA